MTESFDIKESVSKAVIDVSRAHFWDVTAIAAIDKVIIKFRREGRGRAYWFERGKPDDDRQFRCARQTRC